ncbi:MAG: T9SS type A sorting domain-containing protein [Hymenobacter sp.]|nr:MAG: T9SS type A sorting domain-containing protein [Hymenobacter sp.]
MLNFTFRLWAFLLLGLLAGSARAQHLAAGYRHTLSIHPDGTLWAWGANSYGQLGDGTTTPRNTPVQVGTAANWQSVSAGYYFTVALKTDGTLWAWGQNTNGQLGQGTATGQQSTPLQVGTAATWASVSAGDYHIAALQTDGTLWTWGQNFSGQLGQGTVSSLQSTPTQVGAATWRAASAGGIYTLAIKRDGTLWSWGYNSNAQLGNGTTSTTAQPTPAQVGTASTWQLVSAGTFHSLAIQTDGTLWAWGNNGQGAVGTPTTQLTQATPIQVGTATTWRSISAGYTHSAAVRQDNSLWTWGDNRYNQLGDGTTTQQNAPVQVAAGANWQAVSAGQYYTTALRQDNSYWAWGYHSYGQLGTGPSPQLVPYQVLTPATWRSLSAGAYYNLAIRPDGTLWAWGDNAFGQLGLGTANTATQRLPAQVGTATTWRSVSAGYYHSVAVRQDGTLWAWGDNTFGELGDGTTTAQTAPVQLGTATDWASVSAGYYYTLALKTDGSLWAWGRNTVGQLGLGTTTQQNTPLRVGFATWQSVTTSRSAGASSVSLAIRQDGTLWAWGTGSFGQLGQGNYISQQLTPVQVGTATWQSVAAGNMHALGVRTDGTLWAWGYNTNGQLGTGNTTIRSTPTQVDTGTGWSSVTAGYNSSAALSSNVVLYLWGSNIDGQLGNGTTIDQLTPQFMRGSTIWQAVSMGFFHTAALEANPSGTLWLWGYNGATQLTLPNRTPLPTYVASGGAPLATATASGATTWQLAPNPAHGRTQLLGLPAGPVAGQLFDSQGRLVRITTAAEVELAGLAPGLYLLRAAAGGTTRTLRLAVE